MGRRGPLPKDPDTLQGHRRRVKVNPGPLPEGFVVPAPKDDWRDDTRAAWAAYWASDMALLATEVDTHVVSRLFSLYDQFARAMDVVAKALAVKGSTGQLRTNPLAEYALRLDASILRLEGELGLTPAARKRMGITVRRTVPQPADEPVTKPSPYGHLRAVGG